MKKSCIYRIVDYTTAPVILTFNELQMFEITHYSNPNISIINMYRK